MPRLVPPSLRWAARVLGVAAVLLLAASLRGPGQTAPPRDEWPPASTAGPPPPDGDHSAPWRPSRDALLGEGGGTADAGGAGLLPELALLAAPSSPDRTMSELLADPAVRAAASQLQSSLARLGIAGTADLAHFARLPAFAARYGFPDLNASYFAVKDVSLWDGSTKWPWRYFCFRHLAQSLLLDLPPYPQTPAAATHEAVILEHRDFPHAEFVIRTALRYLGPGWSLRVFCGSKSCPALRAAAARVSPLARVVDTGMADMSVAHFNDRVALNRDFWLSLHGDRVLLFQEDSALFRSGIADLLPYDFAGAPWNTLVTEGFEAVGNGGLSLRTRLKMVEALDRVHPSSLNLTEATKAVLIHDLKYPPEDIYFSYALGVRGVGRVAPRAAARVLVEHTYHSERPLGGHAFLGFKRNWFAFLERTLLARVEVPEGLVLGKALGGASSWSAPSQFDPRGPELGGNGLFGRQWDLFARRMVETGVFVRPGGARTPPRHVLALSLDHLAAPGAERHPLVADGASRVVGFFHGATPAKGRAVEGTTTAEQLLASPAFAAIRPRLDLVITFTEDAADVFRRGLARSRDSAARVRSVGHPLPDLGGTKFDLAAWKAGGRTVVAPAVEYGGRDTHALLATLPLPPGWSKTVAYDPSLSSEPALRAAWGNSSAAFLPVPDLPSFLALLRTSVLLLPYHQPHAPPLLLAAIAAGTPAIIPRSPDPMPVSPAAEEHLGFSYPLFYGETGLERNVWDLAKGLDDGAVRRASAHMLEKARRPTAEGMAREVYNHLRECSMDGPM
ncbi:hypothetical protein DFJ74DRAFT_771586 [Hyaloraphidium curvatum]|nr:hypothetical protein DFJ74DRAFT_771586 [Hyaloraphidium curvatum]